MLQGDNVCVGFALLTIKSRLAGIAGQVTIAKLLVKKMEESLSISFDHLFESKELLTAVTLSKFKLAWLNKSSEKREQVPRGPLKVRTEVSIFYRGRVKFQSGRGVTSP